MRHRAAGKQLSRSTSHRTALRRNMAASLFQHGAIRTTVVKAKELRSFVEKLITVAKKGTLHARRQVISTLNDRAMADKEEQILDKTVVQKLFDEIAPKYANRQGGYTRIIRLAERRIGDAGKQVLLQLVEESKSQPVQAPETAGRRRRRAAKRQEAMLAAQPQQAQESDQEQKAPEPEAQESVQPEQSGQGERPGQEYQSKKE